MNMETRTDYLPGDPVLIKNIVAELKSQGTFDQFRKECISDVDTKPAYQNLCHRVDNEVSSYLSDVRWRSDLNKNQLRESIRKYVNEFNFVESGVTRIVDQLVNPRINTVLVPKVEDIVYEYLGIPREKPAERHRSSAPSSSNERDGGRQQSGSGRDRSTEKQFNVATLDKYRSDNVKTEQQNEKARVESASKNEQRRAPMNKQPSDDRNVIGKSETLDSHVNESVNARRSTAESESHEMKLEDKDAKLEPHCDIFSDSSDDEISPPYEIHGRSDVDTSASGDSNYSEVMDKSNLSETDISNVEAELERICRADASKIIADPGESVDSVRNSRKLPTSSTSKHDVSPPEIPKTPTIHYETSDESDDTYMRKKKLQKTLSADTYDVPNELPEINIDKIAEKIVKHDDKCTRDGESSQRSKDRSKSTDDKKRQKDQDNSRSKDSKEKHHDKKQEHRSEKSKHDKSRSDHKNSGDKKYDSKSHRSDSHHRSKERSSDRKSKSSDKLAESSEKKSKDDKKKESKSSSSGDNRHSEDKKKSKPEDPKHKSDKKAKDDKKGDESGHKVKKKEDPEPKKSKSQCNTDEQKPRNDRRSSDGDSNGPSSSTSSQPSSTHHSSRSEKEKSSKYKYSSSSSHKTKKSNDFDETQNSQPKQHMRKELAETSAKIGGSDKLLPTLPNGKTHQQISDDAFLEKISEMKSGNGNSENNMDSGISTISDSNGSGSGIGNFTEDSGGTESESGVSLSRANSADDSLAESEPLCSIACVDSHNTESNIEKNSTIHASSDNCSPSESESAFVSTNTPNSKSQNLSNTEIIKPDPYLETCFIANEIENNTKDSDSVRNNEQDLTIESFYSLNDDQTKPESQILSNVEIIKPELQANSTADEIGDNASKHNNAEDTFSIPKIETNANEQPIQDPRIESTDNKHVDIDIENSKILGLSSIEADVEKRSLLYNQLKKKCHIKLRRVKDTVPSEEYTDVSKAETSSRKPIDPVSTSKSVPTGSASIETEATETNTNMLQQTPARSDELNYELQFTENATKNKLQLVASGKKDKLEPVASTVKDKLQPVTSTPKDELESVANASSNKLQSVSSAQKSKLQPVSVATSNKSQPVVSAITIKSEPVTSVPEDKLKPVASGIKDKPQPVASSTSSKLEQDDKSDLVLIKPKIAKNFADIQRIMKQRREYREQKKRMEAASRGQSSSENDHEKMNKENIVSVLTADKAKETFRKFDALTKSADTSVVSGKTMTCDTEVRDAVDCFISKKCSSSTQSKKLGDSIMKSLRRAKVSLTRVEHSHKIVNGKCLLYGKRNPPVGGKMEHTIESMPVVFSDLPTIDTSKAWTTGVDPKLVDGMKSTPKQDIRDTSPTHVNPKENIPVGVSKIESNQLARHEGAVRNKFTGEKKRKIEKSKILRATDGSRVKNALSDESGDQYKRRKYKGYLEKMKNSKAKSPSKTGVTNDIPIALPVPGSGTPARFKIPKKANADIHVSDVANSAVLKAPMDNHPITFNSFNNISSGPHKTRVSAMNSYAEEEDWLQESVATQNPTEEEDWLSRSENSFGQPTKDESRNITSGNQPEEEENWLKEDNSVSRSKENSLKDNTGVSNNSNSPSEFGAVTGQDRIGSSPRTVQEVDDAGFCTPPWIFKNQKKTHSVENEKVKEHASQEDAAVPALFGSEDEAFLAVHGGLDEIYEKSTENTFLSANIGDLFNNEQREGNSKLSSPSPSKKQVANAVKESTPKTSTCSQSKGNLVMKFKSTYDGGMKNWSTCEQPEEEEVRYLEVTHDSDGFREYMQKLLSKEEDISLENFSIEMRYPEEYDSVFITKLGATVRRRNASESAESKGRVGSPCKYNTEIITSKSGESKGIMMRIKKSHELEEDRYAKKRRSHEETHASAQNQGYALVRPESTKKNGVRRKTLGIKRSISSSPFVTSRAQTQVNKSMASIAKVDAATGSEHNTEVERTNDRIPSVDNNCQSAYSTEVQRSQSAEKTEINNLPPSESTLNQPNSTRSNLTSATHRNAKRPPLENSSGNEIPRITDLKRKQCYDSSDLYKPRPAFLASSRRHRMSNTENT